MIARGAVLVAVLGLSACGTPWRGDEVSVVAPVAVADAQLIPTASTETTAVAVTPPVESTGSVSVGDIEAVGLARDGTYAVEPSAVADAQLAPAPFDGVSDVAPIAPTGSVGLEQVASVPSVAPVPSRPSGVTDSTNPIGFALATSHPVGQATYSRTGGAIDGLACGGYSSPITAQEAFLRAGGPQADPLGLDVDGDGYACGWDPAPYRAATSG